MADEAQLQWEKRAGRPAAAAAFAAGALLVAGAVVRQGVALTGRPGDSRELLRAVEEEPSALVASGILQGLSFLALGAVLWYLFKATRSRRGELPGWLLPVIVVGPLLFAAAGVAGDLARVDAADEFAASGAPVEERADDLLEERSGVATALGLAGTLGLSFALVFVSINAMRVGLLSRFMGVLGAIVGALYVLPLLTGPYPVELFWVLALGVLFLGRWPGGRGPAWETGEAIPWPQPERRIGPAGDQDSAPPENGVEQEDEVAEEPRKRKRKKKRR